MVPWLGSRNGMGWGIRPKQSRCADVFPAEESVCTKTQQDRARGPGEALWQVSVAGVEEPWGRQEGQAEPDRKFLSYGLDPDDSVRSWRIVEGHDQDCVLDRSLWLQRGRWGGSGV